MTPVVGVVVYALAFALVESIGAVGQSVVSAVLHGVLIIVLLVAAALRPSGRWRALPAALAVVSLLRLLSLGMPFVGMPSPVRALLVSGPLLLAVVLVLRLPGMSVAALGLRPRSWWRQGLVALTGLPLGAAAALAGLPGPDAAGDGWLQVTGFAVAWVIAAVVEELVFRGVVQQAAAAVLGRGAFLCSTAVFAAAYVGSGSATVAAVVGLVFGVGVQLTGSVVGVAVAHALLTVSAVWWWPLLLP